jgi:Metal-dependent hydrolases of the beta-lactamase superfamily I
MLEAYALFSGSAGNCVYIKTGGEEILVDCGKNAKTIECALTKLGSSLSNISAIYITHEHCDHVSALEVISKRYKIPIHAARGTARLIGGNRAGECVVEHPPRYAVDSRSYSIRSFVTPHDSVMCVGYRISTDDGDIGVATDLGCITDEVGDSLLGCRGVVLESNHDRDMLMRGPYPAELKRRILSREGHLSNDDCASFAAILSRSGVGNLLLAHISRDNNLPSLALKTTQTAVAGAGSLKTIIRVASPDDITALL